MERVKRLARLQSFKTFNPFKDERGVALVIVLWIFIFLSVVAFEFAVSVREEGLAAHRYSEEIGGYYLALAGFQESLYRLLETPAPSARAADLPELENSGENRLDGSWHEGALGDGFYRVRLVDEGGKVDLNRADESLLRSVLSNLEVPEPQKSIIVDSILDWRDEDDLHRTNGAERDYYLALAPSYTAKNGPFATVQDLLWVRGVTLELFYGFGEHEVGLRDIFTVDSPMARINLRTTSPEVIHALLGLSLASSRAFVEERKKLSEKTLGDLLSLLGVAAGDSALRQFVFVNPTVITIEAAGYRKDSATIRQIRGVVRLLPGRRGYQIIRWVDRDLVRTESPGTRPDAESVAVFHG